MAEEITQQQINPKTNKQTMKRAIYVGEPADNLEYGMTGIYENLQGIVGPCFKPDGALHAEIVSRLEIYIPSEDQTRHCPKP